MKTDTDMETGMEAPAIRALGSLYKVTQVFLWEDAAFDVPEVSSASARLHNVVEEATDCHGSAVSTIIRSGVDSTINGFIISLEDMELSRQMNELGLPVSFSTNKKNNTVTTKEKRRSMPEKSSGHKNKQEQLVDVSRVSEEESTVQPIVCKDNTNTYCITTNGQDDTSYCCFAEDDNKQQFLSGLTTQVLTTTGPDQVLTKIDGEAKLYDMRRDNVIDSTALKDNTGVTTCSNPLDTENLLQTASSMEHTSMNSTAYLISPTTRSTTMDLDNYRKKKDSCSGLEHEETDKKPIEFETLEEYHISVDNTNAAKIHDGNGSEIVWVSEQVESSQPSDHLDANLQNEFDRCKSCSDLGNWRAVWDDFYMRNYFYNIITYESTWYPPPGMENFAYSDSIAESGEMIADGENNAGPELSGNDNKVMDVCCSQEYTYFFQEAQNDDRLSSYPSLTVASSMEHTSMNSTAYLISPTTRSTTMDLDELEGDSNCFGIKRSSDGDLYPVHSHLLSDTKEPVDRSITTATEIFYEETEESDVPLTGIVDEMDGYHDSANPKKKKKVKTRPRKKKLSTYKKELPLQAMSEGFSVDIVKYWCQRYLLFSRFDDGIKMDEEGWFSVTPELIARHQASRCGSGTVIDCFAGVGGNAIQFAQRCNHVIAIDIDSEKINHAQHNATIYGVNENIDFIKGDFFLLAPKLKGDTIFMSPPWGGPDYAKVQTYDIRTMLKPHDGYLLFKTARRIASRIVMFLPRNVDLNQLAEISLSANPPWSLEVEKNFLNGKFKAITAYFENVSL